MKQAVPSTRSQPKIESKQSSNEKPPPSGARKLLIPGLLLIAALGAYALWIYLHPPSDPNKLRVSGRIEGYETNVGAKIGGRVNFIKVREGDPVKIGEIIVQLSDDDIQAQLRGAYARLQKAMEARDQAEQQIEVTNEAVNQAGQNKEQAIEDAQGRILQAEAQVASARAALSQAESEHTQALADQQLAAIRKERYENLAKSGAVMQDQADQAATALQTTTATVAVRLSGVDAARKNLIAAQGNLTMARSSRWNPRIRRSALHSSQYQLIQSSSQLKAANDEIHNARASVDEIKANIAYLNIPSPINGVVTARAVEPGAVVVAGQTVLSLINLQTVYLRAYMPEGDAGKVRVGQAANVFLDSASNQALPGRVVEIDPVASFTPENIYFKDDRVKQVFGLKIAINDPRGFPKPGMPADGDIILDATKP